MVPITCFILVCLFALQHYGTHRVGFCFAPIVFTWLLCISGSWFVQYFPLEPACISSSLAYVHDKVPEKDEKKRMDVFGVEFCYA
ncbi:potassium transporter 2 [Phtheirospermum japonicum]|uniref:Potassium transporter 2 n=1 Tax=Phtheirospermum japonicum TaxID=374723 RepID=A0A830BGY5_9LAMI|nr:potassium transporter 2 [Phtheirospermum japonicum]